MDVDEANDLLSTLYVNLRVVDNGVIPERMPDVDGQVHAYHVIPAGGGKAEAAAAVRDVRGLYPDECMAVGDSRVDLAVAREVDPVFIVANALAHDPGLALDIARMRAELGPERVIETVGSAGAGVLEAVELRLGIDLTS